MSDDQNTTFRPFYLDVANKRLYKNNDTVALRPKSFAVLEYLVKRPGRLVTKEELLHAAWPETSVTEAVLKVCIREIRDALGDNPDSPRFIQTIHRRGYTFIAELPGNNLPLRLTSFIGREREVSEIKQLLDTTRLLTLTGAGGSGKTRLALRIAGDLLNRFPDGVWWAALASLAEGNLVAPAVASALDIRDQPGRELTQTLIHNLRRKTLLLVMDNCEHLVGSCAELAGIIASSCPAVKLLVTSREPLGIDGETIWQVPTLTLPDTGRLSCLEELANCESVRLFVDRARAADREFILSESNAPAVAQICRRLDGIPLAIELAAARVRVLTAEEIAKRLFDCFQPLTSGDRSFLARHQTLQATMDWSYSLLSEEEQTIFRRLCVFAGGFSLEAAETVLSGEDMGRDPVSDLIFRLVDKSLVTVMQREPAASTRYRLLEPVRHYARNRLLERERLVDVQSRHASFFADFAESVEPHINSVERQRWLHRLEVEHDNLRSALAWAQTSNSSVGRRLAGSLWWFWFHQGCWSEGRTWLRSSLDSRYWRLPRGVKGVRSQRASKSPNKIEQVKPEIAKVLLGAGVLAWTQGDHPVARRCLEDSVSMSRSLRETKLLAYALQFLSSTVLAVGESRLARALAKEAVELFRSHHPEDRFGLAVSLSSLGIAAQTGKDYDEARAYLYESLAIAKEVKDNWAVALPLRNLAIIHLRRGEYDSASALLRESLTVQRDLGEKWFLSRSLESLAEVLAMKGECARAARLFGAGEALRELIGASILRFYREDYDRGVAAARAGMNELDFQAAWKEGRALSLDEALDWALE